MARIFGMRPSEIIDPECRFGRIFALEFDYFCANLAIEMISDGRLI